MDSIQELQAALEAKDAEIERLTEWINLHRGDTLSLSNDLDQFRDDLIEAESRISDLERQLAEETERCALVAENFGIGKPRSSYGGSDIAAAIRGGAK